MRARAWLWVAAFALVGVLLLAVFPGKAYLAQRSQRQALAAEVSDLEKQNHVLDMRVQRLQTDEEIERLGRQDFSLVRPGEEVYSILPGLDPPSPAPPPPPPRHHRTWWQSALSRVASAL